MIVNWKFNVIIIPKPQKVRACSYGSMPTARTFYEEIHYIKKLIVYYQCPLFKDYWPRGFLRIKKFLIKNKKDILAKKITLVDHTRILCTVFIDKENKDEVC